MKLIVAYGGMREISVLDPLPGVVGFFKVVSIRVHPSPLKPQWPSKFHVRNSTFCYKRISVPVCRYLKFAEADIHFKGLELER